MHAIILHMYYGFSSLDQFVSLAFSNTIGTSTGSIISLRATAKVVAARTLYHSYTVIDTLPTCYSIRTPYYIVTYVRMSTFFSVNPSGIHIRITPGDFWLTRMSNPTSNTSALVNRIKRLTLACKGLYNERY